ncbi:MAG: formate dehydrogenase accessory sulfurtransferase FdhD [Actinobacteria bacterium]|nr:formate dehydrogenase accessory sulfurtransferase FdhD [Actinomycetota bacterium]
MSDFNWIVPWEVEYLKKGVRTSGTDLVIVEEPLRIEVNGQPIAALMRLPGDEAELAVGFCISEGYIKGYEGILEVKTVEKDPVKCVRIKALSLAGEFDLSEMLVIRAGCGRQDIKYLDKFLEAVESEVSISTNTIHHAYSVLKDSQYYHSMTGGTHSASLVNDEHGLLNTFEDIGRHNAFDKLIGCSYINSVNLRDRAVFLTGRISSDIAIKAVRCGIPILISMLMPTSFACEIARKFNLTLVGFARGSRANIYTGNQRIRSKE